MAEQRPVANAAWGGRRADGTYPLPTADTPADRRLIQASFRDFMSILLLLLGAVCGVAGGAIVAGWGGALIVVWLTAVPVALLMGTGD